MNSRKSHSDVGKVTVWNESAEVQLGLNVARYGGDADESQQQDADSIVYVLAFHSAPTAWR